MSVAANNIAQSSDSEDLDPLLDLQITFELKEIRAFDKIDLIGDPDFYLKVFVNDVEHVSPVWKNQKYVTENWQFTQDVPDDIENVNIKIQLWDKNLLRDKLCDISFNDADDPISYDVDIVYNLKTGHWFGDDFIYPSDLVFDRSGYGRLNGCDDNSVYENDRDCELWFNIYQNDFDGDGIPYWTEVNVYNTDPEFDDTGRDDDNDGVPIEWEFKWGNYVEYDWYTDKYYHYWYYDPFVWEDHKNIDIDEDGIDNYEEYLTSDWGSDPYRDDLFIEVDQMETGPNGEGPNVLPDGSRDLLRTAFDRKNIVLHLDDGSLEISESDMIPFDELTPREELVDIYDDYFLNNDPDNWKEGVFHYSVICYDGTYNGYAFSGDGLHVNCFQLSTKYVDPKVNLNVKRDKAIPYASVFMHETGHNLGIFHQNTPGCDDQYSSNIYMINWWKWGPYKSCMNYRYTYRLIDYSDGSRGRNDFDDWDTLDLTFFQRD